MLEYRDFYDIACYANEKWNKRNFTSKEVAGYAYDYYADMQWSKVNGRVASNIKTLCENLMEDFAYEPDNEDAKYWWTQITKELVFTDDPKLANRIFDCISDGYDDEEYRKVTVNRLLGELSANDNKYIKYAFVELCAKIEEFSC